ncbi:hypothetical protein ASG90_18085 [Nocardioides sp. Soil797]|nr:hypothetical protein ASG90_18085 [Nocardioides sp. Soil797]
MATPSQITRRKALGGAAAGLSLPLLAACGGDDGGSGSGSTATPSGSDGSSTGSSPSGKGSSQGGSADALVAAADVPEGSGVILDDVVVTQPTKGEFKAFSATCTHMQCKVSEIDTSIHCACHGSQFSIADGSVEAGPASDPLPEESVKLAGKNVVKS